MIFFQGADFKAKSWAKYIDEEVTYFSTLADMWRVARNTSVGDKVVFRYQNNPKSLIVSLLVTSAVLTILMRAKLNGATIFWICHNVDQDTSRYHKLIERFRRGVISRASKKIFVLHPDFVRYVGGKNVFHISFGRKEGGDVSKITLDSIEAHAAAFDCIVLIAGQDGGKYKHFDRLDEIVSCFSSAGVSVGFVLAGVSSSRFFAEVLRKKILLINEKNLDENAISKYIDFIYRENADISMPYTVYAGCSAGIPIVTAPGTVMSKILVNEGIGITLSADNIKQALERKSWRFEEFLSKNRWSSLAERIR